MPRTVLFAFWGRKANVEIQLPFIQRIVDENPDVEFHGWDLCRDSADHDYLTSLPTSDRFQVRTEEYQGDGKAMRGQNGVWRRYANGREYRDTLFVKLDDDDVFLETRAFGRFVDAIDTHRDHIISALTINNGASTPLIPALQDGYEHCDIPVLPDWKTITGPVHLSAEYAEMCHRWFIDNWRTLIDKPTLLSPCENDWLSINCIGLDHQMLRRVAQWIGRPHPRVVAGRHFRRGTVGDEGAANMMPRLIDEGFVAAHLNFGPQVAGMSGSVDELRKHYADIARQYLV